MTQPLSVFILAGEASGDALGAALLRGLDEEGVSLTLSGVGGEGMIAEGLTPIFPMSDLSVMGIAEVLPRLRLLFRRLDQCVDTVLRLRPDIVITIDAPDFSFRLHQRLKRQAPCIHRVHYVAPTVWAWRPGRALKVARLVDQLLALLPFEPPYFTKHGLDCRFVGHPIATRQRPDAADIASFRSRHDLGDAPLLLVLPGSRRSEIARLGPIFAETAKRFVAANPSFVPVLPVAQGAADAIAALDHLWPTSLLRLGMPAEKACAFSAADLALAASGTVSLELALHDTPMVIGYDVNWFSRMVARALVQLDTVTLVNLISETRSVPEYLGPQCRPENLLSGLQTIHADPAPQRAALRQSLQALGQGGVAPGRRAAQAVLEGWHSRQITGQ